MDSVAVEIEAGRQEFPRKHLSSQRDLSLKKRESRESHLLVEAVVSHSEWPPAADRKNLHDVTCCGGCRVSDVIGGSATNEMACMFVIQVNKLVLNRAGDSVGA